MIFIKDSKLKLPPRDWGIKEALRKTAAFMRTHIRAIAWSLYIFTGMGICVVLAWLKQKAFIVYVPALFFLPATGFLLLKWIRKTALETEVIRDENEKLRYERNKLIRDASDYPQLVKGLENQKQGLENQLKNEEGAAEELRTQIKEITSHIAALESEQKELNRRIGFPRRDIELTNQEVANGEIHLLIKVPPPPKEALKYQEQEEFRLIRRQDIVSESVEDLAIWLNHGPIQWAYSKSSTGDIRCIKQEDVPSDHDVFFIGDIHGDNSSLRRTVKHVDEVDPQATLVFLGDLFDRGAQEMEAVCFFLSLVKSRPGKILWIVGNHDAALKFENNSFLSTVSPASFCEKLNSHPEWKEFGLGLIGLIEKLPVAAIFPDGLWVSHGAVPHSDVQDKIADLSTLPIQARIDCVNARLVDQMKKIPNRGSTTHDVGFDNVMGFVKIVREKTGIEIRQLLCAHQHTVTDGMGIAQYRKYFKNILCHGLFTSSDNFVGGGKISPCIAKYCPDKAPLIYSLE